MPSLAWGLESKSNPTRCPWLLLPSFLPHHLLASCLCHLEYQACSHQAVFLVPKASIHRTKVSPHQPPPCPTLTPEMGPTRTQTHSRSTEDSSKARQSQGVGVEEGLA